MKRTIQNLTMAAALLLGAAAMSSCAGFVDALLGHEDTPAETPTKPTTSDTNDGGSHEGSDMSLPPGAGFNRVDLSTLTEDYTFKDGDVLTGTLDGTKTVIKLSVAPDAKVILSGAQILGEDQGIWVNKWAGLTCLGNATIILDGENTVRSFDRSFPCIQAGPDGSKLIITGDGKLTTDGRSLAGIGSAENITCGDIEIQGGDLTLKDCGIGIGSGAYGSCGNITITGGTITVQGIHRAGIGNAGSSCGNITISGGIISTQGGGVGIGCGYNALQGFIQARLGCVCLHGIGYIALRVCVYHKRLKAPVIQAGCQCVRGRGLANAAFLILQARASAVMESKVSAVISAYLGVRTSLVLLLLKAMK